MVCWCVEAGPLTLLGGQSSDTCLGAEGGVTALEAYQAPAGYWKMSAALGPTRVPDESKGQDATLKAS